MCARQTYSVQDHNNEFILKMWIDGKWKTTYWVFQCPVFYCIHVS